MQKDTIITEFRSINELIWSLMVCVGGSYLSVHEQSQGEGHSQAPLSEILLTVHSGVGVARRETHEQGSFAGHAVVGRPAVVSGSPRLFSAALRGQKKTGGGSNTGLCACVCWCQINFHSPQMFHPKGKKEASGNIQIQ